MAFKAQVHQNPAVGDNPPTFIDVAPAKGLSGGPLAAVPVTPVDEYPAKPPSIIDMAPGKGLSGSRLTETQNQHRHATVTDDHAGNKPPSINDFAAGKGLSGDRLAAGQGGNGNRGPVQLPAVDEYSAKAPPSAGDYGGRNSGPYGNYDDNYVKPPSQSRFGQHDGSARQSDFQTSTAPKSYNGQYYSQFNP